jgi:hypothetical protein
MAVPAGSAGKLAAGGEESPPAPLDKGGADPPTPLIRGEKILAQ